MRGFKFIFVILLSLFSISMASDKIPAKVLYVIDGDTIKVFISGKKESVRLIGIDTPESRKNKRAKKQAREFNTNVNTIVYLGKKSKNFVEKLVRKGDVVYLELDVQPRDRYGRILAYVWLRSGKMLNKEIICSGYAMPLTIPPNVKYAEIFRQCFRKAKLLELGLWSDI
ncbi:thermonuclease family protein [Persephonella sp.]